MVAFTRGKRLDPRVLSPQMRAFFGEPIPSKKFYVMPRGGISGIAPSLSLVNVANFPTSATFTMQTNFDNGFLYFVVSTNPATPTLAQILAGQDSTGAPGAAHGSSPIFSGTFQPVVTATGLTPLIAYSAFLVQLTSNNHASNIVPVPFNTFGPSLKFEVAANSMYLGGPS